MTYDEFSNKLDDIKREFKHAKNHELTTVKQLEDYLMERKYKRTSGKLKSLKGLSI